MFKVLLLIFVFFFVLFRIGGFFLRLIFGRMQTRQNQNFNRSSHQKPADGNVHIDHIPKEKESKNYKGGDYIDYEEVK